MFVVFMLCMFSVNVHMRHHCLSIRSVDFFSGLSYFIGCSPHFTKFGLSWHGFRFHERSIPFQSDGSMNRTVLLKRTKFLIAEQSE